MRKVFGITSWIIMALLFVWAIMNQWKPYGSLWLAGIASFAFLGIFLLFGGNSNKEIQL